MIESWRAFLPPHAQVMAKTQSPPLIVRSDGRSSARLMFVGELSESQQLSSGGLLGGADGLLLTKMIEAMSLSCKDVHLMGILQSTQPPQSMLALPTLGTEALEYHQDLWRRIELAKPEVLVTLGPLAAGILLQTQEELPRLRGIFREIQGLSVLATFHPSYLLQNPAAKKDAWEDLQKVMQKLGLKTRRASAPGNGS